MADKPVEKLKFAEDPQNDIYIVTDPNAIKPDENNNIILGLGTKSQTNNVPNQLILGEYNSQFQSDPCFIMVGGGESEEYPKNVYTLSKTGKGYYADDLKVDGDLNIKNILTVDKNGVNVSNNLSIGNTIIDKDTLENASQAGESINQIKINTALNENSINLKREFYLWTKGPTPLTYNDGGKTKVFSKSDTVLVDNNYFYIIFEGADIFRIAREMIDVGVPSYTRTQFIEDNNNLITFRQNIYGAGCIADFDTTPESLINFLPQSETIGSYLISNDSDNICFINKTNIFESGSKANSSNFIKFVRGANADKIGKIFYNSINNKLYATGTMSRKLEGYNNNTTIYNIYELNFETEETVENETTVTKAVFTTTLKGSFGNPEKPFLSIIQNVAMYNGYLYVGCSNPNCIIVVNLKSIINDSENEEPAIFPIENIAKINERMDHILPVGELQGCSFNNGRLYISGDVKESISGVKNLTTIGSIAVQEKDFLNHTDSASSNILDIFVDVTLNQGHIGGTNLAKYVNRTSTYHNNSTSGTGEKPSSATGHQFIYDMYTTATGFCGDYDYLPFHYLWEAVEASVGYFALFGQKVRISIASVDNAAGDTYNHYQTIIPGWAISEIRGYAPSYINGVTKQTGAFTDEYAAALKNNDYSAAYRLYQNNQWLNPNVKNNSSGATYPLVRYLKIIDGTVSLLRIGLSGFYHDSLWSTRENDPLDGVACLEAVRATIVLNSCQFLRTSSIINGRFKSLISLIGSQVYCYSFGDSALWTTNHSSIYPWTTSNYLPSFTVTSGPSQTRFVEVWSGLFSCKDDLYDRNDLFPRYAGDHGYLMSVLKQSLENSASAAASAFNRNSEQDEILQTHTNRLRTNQVEDISYRSPTAMGSTHNLVIREKDDVVVISFRFQLTQALGSEYVPIWSGLPIPIATTYLTASQVSAGKESVLIQITTGGVLQAQRGEAGYYQGTICYIAD